MNIFERTVRAVLKPYVFSRLKARGVIHFRRERLYKELMVDLLVDGRTTLKQKLWCYRRGFLSDKLMRYRLTESNYKDYLSDFDFYRRDNYTNKRFSRFFDDKLMTYFFLEQFRRHMPTHYFFNSAGKLNKLAEHPYGTMAELVQGVGEVAAKAAFGRHGEGFVKFAYAEGAFYRNGEKVSADDVNASAASLSDFIFTQYARNHPDLMRAAPISTMVFRAATVFDPELGPGIIGMSTRWQRTGTTLIVDQPGGVQCGVDIEHGTFFRPIDIVEQEFAEEGGPIEEYGLPARVPCFDEMKRLVIEVSSALPYTPYLSFDIAIGADGPLILEINSHGIPRALQMFRPYFHDERARKLFHTSW